MNFMTNFFKSTANVKPDGFPLMLRHIQTIRLAMAILEIEPSMQMPVGGKNIFDFLNKYFNYSVQYYVHPWQVNMRKDISFDHEKPSVTIGALTLPLVFPRQMLDFCHMKWQNTDRITFSGMKTQKRLGVLKKWLKDIYDLDVALEEANGYKTHDISITWNKNGRQFPVKAWDEAYYDELLTSGFVLCPDGDFIWTYRFFESVICGAIPIIEHPCQLYEGFYYYHMRTPREELIYRPEQAADNFKLVMQKFTLSEKTNA